MSLAMISSGAETHWAEDKTLDFSGWAETGANKPPDGEQQMVVVARALPGGTEF